MIRFEPVPVPQRYQHSMHDSTYIRAAEKRIAGKPLYTKHHYFEGFTYLELFAIKPHWEMVVVLRTNMLW